MNGYALDWTPNCHCWAETCNQLKDLLNKETIEKYAEREV
jgi:hypothetical protein